MGADADEALRWRIEFGDRVRGLRHAKGLSQMTLAHTVGLHPTYISSIERGVRNVSLVNIHVLARGLGVRPHELLT